MTSIDPAAYLRYRCASINHGVYLELGAKPPVDRLYGTAGGFIAGAGTDRMLMAILAAQGALRNVQSWSYFVTESSRTFCRPQFIKPVVVDWAL